MKDALPTRQSYSVAASPIELIIDETITIWELIIHFDVEKRIQPIKPNNLSAIFFFAENLEYLEKPKNLLISFFLFRLFLKIDEPRHRRFFAATFEKMMKKFCFDDGVEVKRARLELKGPGLKTLLA